MRGNRIYLLFFMVLIPPLLPAQQAMNGKALYEQSCQVCHAEDGTGAMPGVADLTGTKGPLTRTNDQLVRSIREGVQREGAAMTMPPNGGNPLLSEDDIANIINYMRKTF